MSTRRIVTLGNAFLDTIVYLPVLPTAPTKIRATDVRRTGGGIAATAAYTTAGLGAETAYWGRLGQDDTGDQILSRLNAAGVRTTAVQRVKGGVSPIGTVLVSPGGDRMAFGFIGRDLGDAAARPAGPCRLFLGMPGSACRDWRYRGGVAICGCAVPGRGRGNRRRARLLLARWR